MSTPASTCHVSPAKAVDRLAKLEEAGQLWVDAIDELADLDEHTPERAAVRNLMLSRLDKLEDVFRRILAREVREG